MEWNMKLEYTSINYFKTVVKCIVEKYRIQHSACFLNKNYYFVAIKRYFTKGETGKRKRLSRNLRLCIKSM